MNRTIPEKIFINRMEFIEEVSSLKNLLNRRSSCLKFLSICNQVIDLKKVNLITVLYNDRKFQDSIAS